MRDFGKLATRFWTIPKVLQLSNRAKLVFIYLLAGNETNAIGCFRCKPEHIAANEVCSVEEAEAALEELAASEMIRRDKQVEVILIPSFLKYNAICNQNSGKAAAKALDQIPPTGLAEEVKRQLRAEKFAKFMPEGWGGSSSGERNRGSYKDLTVPDDLLETI